MYVPTPVRRMAPAGFSTWDHPGQATLQALASPRATEEDAQELHWSARTATLSSQVRIQTSSLQLIQMAEAQNVISKASRRFALPFAKQDELMSYVTM